MTAGWSHDALAADLAGHLRGDRRMVWQDIQLGPGGSPRPDVYAIFKSFVAPAPMAYECKVSVSDFRSDVTSGKWQSYLPYSSGVVFAVPLELGIGKTDVPVHAGLIVRGPKGWRAAKRPVLNPVTIPQNALLKLLIDGVEREGPRYRAKQWDRSGEELRRQCGEQVADFMRDSDRARVELQWRQSEAERVIDRAKQEAERIKAAAGEHDAARRELIAALGLPEWAKGWQIADAVRRLREAAREHPAEQRLRQLTDELQRLAERFGAREEPAA